jgi:hypothetical protein
MMIHKPEQISWHYCRRNTFRGQWWAIAEATKVGCVIGNLTLDTWIAAGR